jgi:hypothetical protein
LRYALALLTHGDNADVLERTVRSFDSQVSPPPVTRFLFKDGPSWLPPLSPYPWEVTGTVSNQGFCTATRALWAMVTLSRARFDYVFWMEHDFEFKRTVDLTGLAVALDENVRLAQMSLLRDAVNPDESENGGVIGKHVKRGEKFVSCGRYLEHSSYFTTTPNLMTREFMSENQPPAGPECEGKFGADLRAKEYTFGIWGDGTPWVTHIGRRNGTGY